MIWSPKCHAIYENGKLVALKGDFVMSCKEAEEKLYKRGLRNRPEDIENILSIWNFQTR